MLWLVRGLFATRGAVVGGLLVVTLIGLAVVSRCSCADATSLDIDHGLSELGAPQAPSLRHPLGTDALGRGVLARIMAGAATSLFTASVATGLALLLGLAVGLCAGYAGGRVDGLLMRLVDLAVAFPALLLAILLVSVFRGTSLANTNVAVVLTLALVGWTTMARVIRGKTMALARGEMVAAVRALGASPVRVLVRHVLPNLAGLVVAVALIGFAENVAAEAVLSFLGLGPPPPATSWGRMFYDGRLYYRTSPHLVLAPGLAILATVGGFHLLGEAVRERFDPRALRGRV